MYERIFINHLFAKYIQFVIKFKNNLNISILIDFHIHFEYNMYMEVKMDNLKILKNFMEKNNGILLSSDAKKLNIHKQYIKLLCDCDYIERKERGVYVKKGKSLNEFFLLQQKYKTGIYSHNTALYFYHLTDRTPLKYDLTFQSNIRVNNEVINPHYIKKDYFEIGKTALKIQDGTSIILYDLERTIIDLLRNRNKIDIQIFNMAMNEYIKRKDKNLVKLSKYAKIFKQENVLKKYMEVLL